MMSLPAEPPTPPTRTSEALRAELQEVNVQLQIMRRGWEDERRQLMGDNAVLQDAAMKLNAEVRNVKDELRKYASAERAGERERAGIEGVSAIRLRITSNLAYTLSPRNSPKPNARWRSLKPN